MTYTTGMKRKLQSGIFMTNLAAGRIEGRQAYHAKPVAYIGVCHLDAADADKLRR
ncbi:hypothetical protein ACFOHW_06080 [Paenibacillus abyssi]|uniref:hypothetical protein n=1 Tax=Paenibacillus abyssi TaxID=1340531 RepID=UPI003610B2D6